jgi:peptidoglycan/xylan/chitin deacetylase (PgdA/CDA1 family)
MFHSVDALESPLSFPPDLFRRGLAWLREQNFDSLTVTQASDCLIGKAPAPERPFAITFDDGYQSVFTVALPILKDLGYSATVYLNSAGQSAQLPPMEGRPRLTWDEIGLLCENDFEIGAHSVTHADLTKLAGAALDAEIAGSREAIENRLGSAVTTFAYPYGYWNSSVRAVVSRCFRCACTADLNVADAASDVFALPRLEMHYFRTLRTFRLLASSRLPAYLSVRRIPRAIRRSMSG